MQNNLEAQTTLEIFSVRISVLDVFIPKYKYGNVIY